MTDVPPKQPPSPFAAPLKPQPPSSSLFSSFSASAIASFLFPFQIPLTHPLWTHVIERFYALPPSPPRRRARPMQVLCVGLPRSGTESLQQALLTLGYDHTYHGWDIVFDTPSPAPGWVALARKKWFSGERLAAEDFDALLGHSVAVTDAAASCFAADMIAAYPDAKVVLNMRRDAEGWKKSLRKTLVHANESWGFWVAAWLDRECFWAWHVYERFLWPLLFRAGDGGMKTAVEGNAEWVLREHCAMIRGLVPKERLLEWYIEDGWEPLCKFLGKPVPDEEFPHANAATGGWKTREEQCNKRWVEGAFVNLLLMCLGMSILVVLVIKGYLL